MLNRYPLVYPFVTVFIIALLSASQLHASGGPARSKDSSATSSTTNTAIIKESGGVKLPSARLAFQSSSYGFIVGVNQGSGTLTYQDEDFPFSIKGYSIGTIGGAEVDAIGVVYNLDDVGDFPGNYKSLKGSLTVGQGGGSEHFKNEHGVVIEVQMLQKGAELSLGGSRVEIAFEPQS